MGMFHNYVNVYQRVTMKQSGSQACWEILRNSHSHNKKLQKLNQYNGFPQLWPEIPVISTKKTPFIKCIVPLITTYNFHNWPQLQLRFTPLGDKKKHWCSVKILAKTNPLKSFGFDVCMHWEKYWVGTTD